MKLDNTKLKKIAVCILPIVSILLLQAIKILYNKFVTRRFMPCLFYVTTGYKCPGCGGTHSFYALMRGNILQSLQYNALVPILALSFVVIYIRAFIKIVLQRPILILPKDDRWIYIPLILFFIYCILRNIV